MKNVAYLGAIIGSVVVAVYFLSLSFQTIWLSSFPEYDDTKLRQILLLQGCLSAIFFVVAGYLIFRKIKRQKTVADLGTDLSKN